MSDDKRSLDAPVSNNWATDDASDFAAVWSGDPKPDADGLYAAQCHRCGVDMKLGRVPFKTETCAGCCGKWPLRQVSREELAELYPSPERDAPPEQSPDEDGKDE